MDDLFSKLFDRYRESVIVTKDGRTIYFNAAALKLFPALKVGAPTKGVLPALLLEHPGHAFSGSVQTGARPADTLVSDLDGYRVITVYPPTPDVVSSAFLDTLGASLRDSLAVLQISGGFLRPYVESTRDPKIQRYAAMANHSYHSLLRIAEGLMRLAELSGHSRSYSFDAFDLVPLVRDLISTVSKLLEGRDLTLRLDPMPAEAVIRGSAALIEQLLLALLSNSIKYTPAGGQITISVSRGASGFLLTVRDNGCGMDAAKLTAAFSGGPMRREDAPEPLSGTGLGLPTVQHIAQLHDGSAIIESNPGRGTAVTVQLPPLTGARLSTAVVPYTGYMTPILTALSDVLDWDAYTEKFSD